MPGAMKRKRDDFDDDVAMTSTDQRKSILDISMLKLRSNPPRKVEPSLRRSVLIFNTLKTIEAELKLEGVTVPPNPTPDLLPVIQDNSDVIDVAPPCCNQGTCNSCRHSNHVNVNNCVCAIHCGMDPCSTYRHIDAFPAYFHHNNTGRLPCNTSYQNIENNASHTPYHVSENTSPHYPAVTVSNHSTPCYQSDLINTSSHQPVHCPANQSYSHPSSGQSNDLFQQNNGVNTTCQSNHSFEQHGDTTSESNQSFQQQHCNTSSNQSNDPFQQHHISCSQSNHTFQQQQHQCSTSSQSNDSFHGNACSCSVSMSVTETIFSDTSKLLDSLLSSDKLVAVTSFTSLFEMSNNSIGSGSSVANSNKVSDASMTSSDWQNIDTVSSHVGGQCGDWNNRVSTAGSSDSNQWCTSTYQQLHTATSTSGYGTTFATSSNTNTSSFGATASPITSANANPLTCRQEYDSTAAGASLADIDCNMFDFDLFMPSLSPSMKLTPLNHDDLAHSLPSTDVPFSPAAWTPKSEHITDDLDHIMQILVGL